MLSNDMGLVDMSVRCGVHCDLYTSGVKNAMHIAIVIRERQQLIRGCIVFCYNYY